MKRLLFALLPMLALLLCVAPADAGHRRQRVQKVVVKKEIIVQQQIVTPVLAPVAIVQPFVAVTAFTLVPVVPVAAVVAPAVAVQRFCH